MAISGATIFSKMIPDAFATISEFTAFYLVCSCSNPKNKILIKGSVEVDAGYIPEVGFVSKLFGMLTVDVDSHTISSNKVK